MSNENNPKGFRAVGHLKGGTPGRISEYTIASGLAEDLHMGQAVKSTGTGVDINGAAVGGAVRGIFQGAEYLATDGEVKFVRSWISGTVAKTGSVIKAFVIDDPDTLFEIQVDSPGLTAAKVGLFGNTLIGTGNLLTGQSTAQADESTLGTGNQYKVLSLASGEAYALNSNALVMFVNHELSGAAAGVAV